MKKDFNEEEINNDNTSLDNSNEFEENDDSSFVSEFNADDSEKFDFSDDEAIIDDYQQNILENNEDLGDTFPFSANIFDNANEDAISLKTLKEKNDNYNDDDESQSNFNESIFNDIKNDTFRYEDNYDLDNQNEDVDTVSIDFDESLNKENNESNDDFIPFDTSVFDNYIDNSDKLDINFSSEFESSNDEELSNEDDVNKIDISNQEEDDSLNDDNVLEENNQDDDITDDNISDKNVNKEEIYKKIDKSIQELDANTDFSIEKDDELVTDINNLFVKVNSNVKEAGDIFTRNVEMKKILDTRFEELKKLQSDIEIARKNNYDEITNYKEEVINKLSDKKKEIDEKLELLKNLQSDFEKEKNEFESYKKEEFVKIEKMRKEEETSFDKRREELNKIEDKLRKQKDYLEEEKRQLSLDQIKYETDKNELANNMIKFNEIVSKFTNGINGIE